MKACVYLRVSTEEQRERQTIQNQREFAEKHCAANGIEVLEYFCDDGVSGTIPLPDRPAGKRLLEGAADGLFDSVLVYKIDRLGRDARVILNAVNDLSNMGVQVVSMTEPFESGTSYGKFTTAVLGAVAGLERDVLIERSRAGSRRLAQSGAWLGGIVPYGYRVRGKGAAARLRVSEELIPGLNMSEADVVRLVYSLCANDGLSCRSIADNLNALGVPTSYIRDERLVLRGKRKASTSGRWMPGRVRNMIVSTTYRGVHEYGKRGRNTEVISRPCDAIVDADVWNRAQETLRRNFIFAARNTRRQYLLRGLVKCGLCGLTYTGSAGPDTKDGKQRIYYKCSGRAGMRGFYGALGKHCPSKAIGSRIEDVVMGDILTFLCDPNTVMQHLTAQLEEDAAHTEKHAKRLEVLERRQSSKNAERDRVIGLFRRGLITEDALEVQLQQLRDESDQLLKQITDIRVLCNTSSSSESMLRSAEKRLEELAKLLAEPLPFAIRRRLVECLVGGVKVNTIQGARGPMAEVAITYLFSELGFGVAARTGTREEHNLTIERTYRQAGRRGGEWRRKDPK